ncbi:MAG TPA: type II toxin-antitoxin system RelE/ParE family toxin [Rhizobiaceae bacterium]|nr:type II toxin-antitoxin system RelE/ParE family toxin [Rhizobiaceae bacterium]
MRVRWTIPAASDIDDIQTYIAQESPVAAYRLANDLIDRTEQLLSANPRAGRVGRVSGTRELAVSRTPYIVVYRVTSDVEIVAVIHGAREWPESFT